MCGEECGDEPKDRWDRLIGAIKRRDVSRQGLIDVAGYSEGFEEVEQDNNERGSSTTASEKIGHLYDPAPNPNPDLKRRLMR